MNPASLFAACLVGLVVCGPWAGAARAQDTTRAPAADSLALEERLVRAEAAIELLRQQLGMQAESGVHTASRARLELSGRVLMNTFSNTRRVNNVDVPQFVLPDVTAGPRSGGAGASVRQTLLGASVTVEDVLGGTVVGDIEVDFFGGQMASSGGRMFPLLRIRTARMMLRRDGFELLAGQESPLIAGIDPISLASTGSPAFAGAGNLWLWLPQLRMTVETAGRVRLGVQAAVLAPTTGDAAGLFDTDVDAAERARRPYLQARLRARWAEDEITGGEIGCGVHKGWLALAGDTLRSTNAVACNYRIPLLVRVELRGEVYDGQALRGLGGGGIGQNLTRAGTPLEDRGGWFQLNVRVTTAMMAGAGCGLSEPDDADPPATGRLRNTACSAHLSLRPAGPLVVGVEYRRIETKYAAGSVANDHINLAFGLEY